MPELDLDEHIYNIELNAGIDFVRGTFFLPAHYPDLVLEELTAWRIQKPELELIEIPSFLKLLKITWRKKGYLVLCVESHLGDGITGIFRAYPGKTAYAENVKAFSAFTDDEVAISTKQRVVFVKDAPVPANLVFTVT